MGGKKMSCLYDIFLLHSLGRLSFVELINWRLWGPWKKHGNCISSGAIFTRVGGKISKKGTELILIFESRYFFIETLQDCWV